MFREVVEAALREDCYLKSPCRTTIFTTMTMCQHVACAHAARAVSEGARDRHDGRSQWPRSGWAIGSGGMASVSSRGAAPWAGVRPMHVVQSAEADSRSVFTFFDRYVSVTWV